MSRSECVVAMRRCGVIAKLFAERCLIGEKSVFFSFFMFFIFFIFFSFLLFPDFLRFFFIFFHFSTFQFVKKQFLRDFHLSWDVVVGLLVLLVVLCGAWSVSYRQPPLRREHGCTVGIDREPPVWCSHPGRMMRTSDRQLLCAWLVLVCRTAHVDTVAGGKIVV